MNCIPKRSARYSARFCGFFSSSGGDTCSSGGDGIMKPLARLDQQLEAQQVALPEQRSAGEIRLSPQLLCLWQ